jgi:hypothetical protein
MKKINICSLAAFVILMLSATAAHAQYNTPVEYMSAISKEQAEITDQFINYTSSVAHGKSARKVEKNRKALVQTVADARAKVKSMPAYKGDENLRNATHEYLELCYNVLHFDYEKIVDMEEIAEQSYDNMEAYLLAQDKVDEKMKEAGDKYTSAYNAFAASNNVTIVDNDDQTNKKLEKIGKVNDYYHKVFLVTFKAMKQYAYLMLAIEKQDVSGIEQNKSTLEKDAAEGLTKLEEIKSFNGDLTLVNASKKMMQFYQKAAATHSPVITNFIMENEKFQELKKNVEGNPKRTQSDVDKYNKAAADMNKTNEKYNKTINDMNNGSNQTSNDWNNAVKNFMDKQMPFKNK